MAQLGPNSTVAVRPLQRKLHEHEPVPQFLRKLIVGLDCLEAQALIQHLFNGYVPVLRRQFLKSSDKPVGRFSLFDLAFIGISGLLPTERSDGAGPQIVFPLTRQQGQTEHDFQAV